MSKTSFVNLIFPIILAIISIYGSWISKEYRYILIVLLLFAIAMYFLTDIYRNIEEQDFEINRLNEKINIYEELIDVKADIKLLKRGLK